MIFNENLLIEELSQFLNTQSINFSIERKLPENNTKVDLFLFTKPPSLIEFIQIGSLYSDHLELLLSKLILLKTVNEGYVKLIIVLYTVKTNHEEISRRIRKSLSNIRENNLINNIVDKKIIIEDIQENQEYPIIDEENLDEIKKAIDNPFQKTDLIRNFYKIHEVDYNLYKVKNHLNNWINSPDSTLLLQSFYYKHFADTLRENIRSSFLEKWDEWRNNIRTSRYRLNNVPDSAQEDFKRAFLTSGWDYENPELEYVFSRYPLRPVGYYPDEETFSLYFEEAKSIRDQLKVKNSDFSKLYNTIRPSLRDMLLNFCLLRSNFKEYLPLKRLTINKVSYSGYYILKFNKKNIIFKVYNPNEIGGSIPVINFGKLLKAFCNEKTELFIFLFGFVIKGFQKDRNYYIEELINLSKNRWNVYPFLTLDENVSNINMFFEKVK